MPAVLETPPERLDTGGGGGIGLPPDDWDRGDRGGGDDDSDDEDFSAPGRRWVTLATFWHPAEAHIARLRLESGGVACLLLDELTAATNVFAIAVGGVKLQVPEAQRERARRLLSGTRPAATAASDDGVAVARFARGRDATAAACVVEAAGMVAEVVVLAPAVPRWVARLAAKLPPHLAARVAPAAEVRVPTGDVAAAAATLRTTPFAAGLTSAARYHPDKPRHDVP